MALPTAQLGAMGGINVPSFVPVTQVDKRPNAWEQALLGILANAGSAVVSKGIENSMAPDYAPDPASGFSKFWNGPTISGQRAQQLDQQSMEQQKIDDAAQNERMNRMVAMTGQNNAQTLGQQRLQAEMGGQINDLQHQTTMEDLAGQEAATTASHQHLQDLIAQLTATKQGKLMDKQSALLGVQVPDIQSQTRQRNAESATKEEQVKMMQKYSGGPTAGAPGVNPNIAKFASQPPDPRLTARLQDTIRYPTADMIMSRNQPVAPEAAAFGQITPDIPPQLAAMAQPSPTDMNQFMPQAPMGHPNALVDPDTQRLKDQEDYLITMLKNMFGRTPLDGQAEKYPQLFKK